GDLVLLAAGDHLGQRALAGPIRAHHGVHLAGTDRQIDAAQDLGAVHARVEVLDLEHGGNSNQPTARSRVVPRSFRASTANSIGSSFSTRLQKPLTIRPTASSSERPRWRA